MQGGIFGQLAGTTARPLHISAHSKDYADLLQIPIKEFQQIIGDEVIKINSQINKSANNPLNGFFFQGRVHIAENHQSEYDFMAVKKLVVENPYNTVKYLLRGQKSIKLPVS